LELLLPEIFLALALSALLVYGVTMSTTIVKVSGSDEAHSPLVQHNIISLSIVTLLAGAGMFASLGWPALTVLRCDGVLVLDGAAVVVKTLVVTRTAVTLWMSYEYMQEEQMRTFEFAVLVLMASLGLCLLAGAYDLIALYIALELQSLCLYALAALRRTSIYSTEAGLKYFVLGAVSSGLRLYGMSLIYGWTGTTQFADRSLILAEGSMPTTFNIGVVLLRVGLLFKVGVVPFHQFVPDVYEGAPTVVTAFFAIVPKAAVRLVLSRLLGFVFYDVVDSWSTLITVCSLASMVVAAFAALSQRRRKRFFAYSSIGHVGYMMMGFASGSIEGIQGIIRYLLVYSVMSVYVWTFILALEQQRGGRAMYFTDLAGLGMHHPLLAFGFAVVMFSMAGVPPLAGFLAKMFVFFSAMESGLYLLAIVGVLSSCIGAFYYIRFMKIMYFETPHTFFRYRPIPRGKGLLMAISLAFVLLLIIDPQPRVSLSRSMALVICHVPYEPSPAFV
jgi:NADH-quinone oxidoreductase subunit N